MSQGFIQIPRSLLDHPSFMKAPADQRYFLIWIIQNSRFLPSDFDDHGITIQLLPGQLCGTIRQFAEDANVKKGVVERSMARFSKFQILRQEVRHTKTVITITHKDTYELIKSYSETTCGTRKRQEKDKKKTQIDNVDTGDTEDKDISLAQTATPLRKKTDIFFDFEHGEWENIKPDDIATWQQAYPAITVNQELLYMREWCLSEPKAKSKKLWRKFITSWLGRSNEKKLNFESSKSQNGSNRAVLGGKRLTEYDTAW